MKVKDIAVVVDAGSAGTADLRSEWDAWNQARHTGRVKAGTQSLIDALVSVSQ